MRFDKVTDPGSVSYLLPPDQPETTAILNKAKSNLPLEVYIGCAKWNRKDLRGFYPKGIKDELAYYSRQFNCIELNATFYRMPDRQQVEIWKNKTPEGFRFFPKITRTISHIRQLTDAGKEIEQFCDAVSAFGDKLGMAFLQLHDSFDIKYYERLKIFLENFPNGIPLAVEVRNKNWFSEGVPEDYASLLEQLGMIHILVDTPGRRDMLHMRLTGPEAFIRYEGDSRDTDMMRLNDWIDRIKIWRKKGLQKLCFFVHHHVEDESPVLASYLINELNKALDLRLKVPAFPAEDGSLLPFL